MQLSQQQPGDKRALPAGSIGARLASDSRAAITIEFALIVPFLLGLFLAMAEVGAALLATQRMHDTVSAMARRVALEQITLGEVEQLILAELEKDSEDEHSSDDRSPDNDNPDSDIVDGGSDSPTDEDEPRGYWVTVTSTGETSAAIEVGIAFREVSLTDFVPYLQDVQLRTKVDVVH